MVKVTPPGGRREGLSHFARFLCFRLGHPPIHPAQKLFFTPYLQPPVCTGFYLSPMTKTTTTKIDSCHLLPSTFPLARPRSGRPPVAPRTVPGGCWLWLRLRRRRERRRHPAAAGCRRGCGRGCCCGSPPRPGCAAPWPCACVACVRARARVHGQAIASCWAVWKPSFCFDYHYYWRPTAAHAAAATLYRRCLHAVTLRRHRLVDRPVPLAWFGPCIP